MSHRHAFRISDTMDLTSFLARQWALSSLTLVSGCIIYPSDGVQDGVGDPEACRELGE